MFSLVSSLENIQRPEKDLQLRTFVTVVTDNLKRTKPTPIRETSILLLGQLGLHARDVPLQGILIGLLSQLGAGHGPLRSLANVEVRDHYFKALSLIMASCTTSPNIMRGRPIPCFRSSSSQSAATSCRVYHRNLRSWRKPCTS